MALEISIPQKEWTEFRDAIGTLKDGLPKQIGDAVTPIAAKMDEVERKIEAIEKIMPRGERVYLPGDGSRRDYEAYNALGKTLTVARHYQNTNRDLPEGYSRAQTEGTDTAGGVLVPTLILPEVLRIRGERNLARMLGRVVPMGSDKIVVPTLSGAGTVYWVDEGTAPTETAVTFKSTASSLLDAKTLCVLDTLSRDLKDDALVVLEGFLAEVFTEGMDREETRVMLVGDTTASDPFDGIVKVVTDNAGTYSNKVTLASNAFSAIKYGNLVDAEFSVDDDIVGGDLSWVMRKTAFREAMKLEDDNHHPIWSRGSGLPAPQGGYPSSQQARPTYLMETPTYLTRQMPNSGTGKCFGIVGAFKAGALLGDRMQMEVVWDDSIHVKERKRTIIMSERVAIRIALPQAFAIIVAA